MRKILFLLIPVLLFLSGCGEYMVAEGIGIYEPDADDSPGIYAELPEEYSLEFMVDSADVIAKVITEDLTHVEVKMEEKDALGKRGIFAFIRYTDVYYTWTVNESERRDSNIYIDYMPGYANVTDPGFAEGGEYIVFLTKISPEMPFVFHNFYDYFLLTDYVTYMLEATPDNEEYIKGLISDIKN